MFGIIVWIEQGRIASSRITPLEAGEDGLWRWPDHQEPAFCQAGFFDDLIEDGAASYFVAEQASDVAAFRVGLKCGLRTQRNLDFNRLSPSVN